MDFKKMVKLLGQFLVITMAAVFFLPRFSASANELNRKPARDPLGETLRHFRKRYPKAVCGRHTSLDITPQTLVGAGIGDEVDCCLFDKDTLTEFSPFRIVNLDDCAVHASFWRGKLFYLYYLLDVRSIQSVLFAFEKLYGTPSHMLKEPEDATELFSVNWYFHGTSMDLTLCRTGGQDLSGNFTHAREEPWLQVVGVSVWNENLAHS